MKRVLLALAFAMAACTAVPPVASAQPPGFPDMSGFADVTNDYIVDSGRGSIGVQFSTPDGIDCGFGTPKNVTHDSQLVTCNGVIPGLSNFPHTGTQGPCDGGVVTVSKLPGQILHYGVGCGGGGNKVLNPGQKVTYGFVTCGVAEGGVTACIDTDSGNHGFILSPSGSSVF